MACYATGSREGDNELRMNEVNRRVTELTAMLCSLCASIENSGRLELFSDDILTWWSEHKKIDADKDAKLRE